MTPSSLAKSTTFLRGTLLLSDCWLARVAATLRIVWTAPSELLLEDFPLLDLLRLVAEDFPFTTLGLGMMVLGLGCLTYYLLVVDVVFVRKRKVFFIMNALAIAEHYFAVTFFLLHEQFLLARKNQAEIAPDSYPLLLYTPRVQWYRNGINVPFPRSIFDFFRGNSL
jgi:hypothetical protein